MMLPFKIVGAVAVAILGLTILFGSWVTVDQGHKAIVLRNGEIHTELDPGLHVKAPWIDDVQEFSTRTTKEQWQGIQTQTRDNQKVTFNITLNYRLNPKYVKKVYADYGMDYAQRMIWPQVGPSLADVIGVLKATDIPAQRILITDRFLTRLIARVPKEFILESVQIVDYDYDPKFRQTIEEAADMQAQGLKSEQQKIREQTQAEILVIQAQAQADAAFAKGQAEANVIKAKGDAEAQAIKAKSDALKSSPELVQLTIAQAWNGVLPVNMYANSPVPLLNLR